MMASPFVKRSSAVRKNPAPDPRGAAGQQHLLPPIWSAESWMRNGGTLIMGQAFLCETPVDDPSSSDVGRAEPPRASGPILTFASLLSGYLSNVRIKGPLEPLILKWSLDLTFALRI